MSDFILDAPDSEGNVIAKPGVVRAHDGNLQYQYPTTGVKLIRMDDGTGDKPYALVDSPQGGRFYPLAHEVDLDTDSSTSTVTWRSYDMVYTARPFTEEDGTWYSRFSMDLPTAALEEMAMADAQVFPAPGDSAQAGEQLFAGVDEESGTIRALLYTNGVGLYSRGDGEWLKVPETDESLDGVTVYNVTPEFIAVWDNESEDGGTVLAEAAEPYAAEFANI